MNAGSLVNKLLFLVALIILYGFNNALGQAPKIIYPATPASYPINQSITPLIPNNSGGLIPATGYGHVSIFSGLGISGTTDGLPNKAEFSSPCGMAIDNAGNIFVADYGSGILRKVSPTGSVNTIQLTGLSGFQGFNPYGIAVDRYDNLFVTDPFQNTIWKITPAGVISVLAGGTQGSLNGKGALAQFNHPLGITIDGSGNLYIADTNNNSIRKIDANGLVTTITTGLNFPVGIIMDSNNNLYVSNTNGSDIKKITPANVVTTIAGGASIGSQNGVGSLASFNSPHFITLDSNNNLYVVDSGNNLIRMVTPAGVVTILAGSGLFNPIGIIIDNAGSLYVSDSGNNVIKKISLYGYSISPSLPPNLIFDATTGIISGTPAGASPATPYIVTAYNASGSSSATVTIKIDNNATASLPPAPKFTYPTPNNYTVNTPITPIGPTTLGGPVPATIFGSVSTFAGKGTQAGYQDATGTNALFTSLWGIDMDAAGNLLVADGPRIRKVSPTAVVTTLAGGNPNGVSDGTGTAAGFGQTAGLVVLPSGNIIVGDLSSKTLRQVTPGGTVTTIAGNGINNFDPVSLASGASGDLFEADQTSDIIRDFTGGGSTSTIFAGTQGITGSNNGNIAQSTYNQPADIKFDQAGNMFVADENNNMIREINAGGVVTTVAGKTTPGLIDGPDAVALFNRPDALVIDPVNNIYVADWKGIVIRMIDANGYVVSVAGDNARKISVDGIGATANFNQVAGLVYSNGVLYAADKTSIRKIIVTGYSIDKPLPSGLIFDSTTGTISGTPNAVSPATQYTIIGYNTGGSFAFTITLAVDPPPPPVISYPTPEVYTRNKAIAPLVPNTSAGGAPSSTATSAAYTIDKPLPPGLILDPTTGIISGTPTVISLPTDYTITAHNDGGTGAFTINITVVAPILTNEVITFNALPVKTYGDADFDPGATSNNSGEPIAYSSDDPTVATIVNGQVHITGAGTANITATQPGDNNYDAAYPVVQPFTVKPFPLTITANDQSRYFGQPNPAFTFSYSPFAYNENASNLLTPPVASTIATLTSAPGKYVINVDGATSANYEITQLPGTLTILQTLPAVVIPNAFTPNGDGINDFWNIKSIEAYPKCIVSVYSRYGTLVYQSKGYPRSWDGTSGGTPVPTGTYYYIINLNEGDSKPLTGYIAVIR
ncbi:MAG: gliding motility-associated C-terminal domain-containing protein [Bacteroidetes bacterium]|jgi:gliding motility-associated-like protein|nr:gliding motility-associated C-terminal domain-containing protein [Bacteroidota bacterium]